MLRVVVDTNLWISFLIGRHLSVLKDLFSRGDVTILSSHMQLTELGEVASRLKFRRYFSEAQAEELLNLLSAASEFVEATEHVQACRDKADDYLLEIAVNGRADIIITGDDDLLALHPFHDIEILPFADFERRMRAAKTGE